MNFIPGTLRRTGDHAEVEFADGTRLPAPYRERGLGGVDGQRVTYGVRPEHLSIGNAGAASRPKSSWSNRPVPIPKCMCALPIPA